MVNKYLSAIPLCFSLLWRIHNHFYFFSKYIKLNDCQKYVFLVVSPRLTPSRITTQNFPMDRLVLEQRSVVISVLFYKFIHYLFGWLCVLGRKTLISSHDSFATTEKSIYKGLIVASADCSGDCEICVRGDCARQRRHRGHTGHQFPQAGSDEKTRFAETCITSRGGVGGSIFGSVVPTWP